MSEQTILRVQTNKINPNITVSSGVLNTGSTLNISLFGSGTTTNPYTGTTTTSGYSYFNVVNDGGVVYYTLTGNGIDESFIYYNYGLPNQLLLGNGTGLTTGNYQVNPLDYIYVNLNGSGSSISSLYFVPQSDPVYLNEDLDLYGDIPIKINKSFAEIQDISKRNSDYSIGLSLPGSKKNNRFFENFYNVDQQTLYFDPTKRVNCQVLIDEQSYFTGYLKLNSVKVQDSKIEYSVTLYSTVGDLFGQIGNNLLKDLDFNDSDFPFNHTFTLGTVTSWEYSFFSQDDPPNYFYPIVHNGYEYSGNTVNVSGITDQSTRLYTSTIVGSYASNAAAYAAGVKRYRINSPQDGLYDNQLKPALNIDALIRLMFKTYGYTIKSDFFNTPWYRLLYLYGYFSSDATKFSYKTPQPQYLPIDGVEILVVETQINTQNFDCYFYPPNPIYDELNTTMTIYVVKKGTGIPCFCTDQINVAFDFLTIPCTGPVQYSTEYFTIPKGSTGTSYNYDSIKYVDCGSGCPYVSESITNEGLNFSASNVGQSYSTLAYPPSPPNTTIFYGENDNVDFNLVIDTNIKQIDLLSSIAKKFNLVFIPDPDVPNQIIIEPFSYYIGSGDIYDWTDKLSWDKGFEVQPALNFVESELILTDQEDGDVGNKIFKDQNNRLYGENKVYNPTEFKSQTKRVDTIFSPELIRKWDTPDTAPNGNISLPLGINYSFTSAEKSSGDSTNVTPQYKGVKTKPKLFYYLGNYNTFLDKRSEVFATTGVSTNGFFITNSSGTTITKRDYVPVISHTMPIGNSDENKINNDSICNLFNSELPTDVGVSTFSAYTQNDIYQLFYQNRIDNIYDKNTRFLSGYVNIGLSDILNLQPKDIIKIQEQYFTWNKIDNYNLTSPELTKVELIQFNNEVSEYPKRYFKYFYCDRPDDIYKFETDMTNPSLSGSSFGWSVLYDYYVGCLGGGVSGFTSSIRDPRPAQTYTYVPYFIYEVNETDYNTGGSGRTFDSLWSYIAYSGSGDLNQFNYPAYAIYNSGATKQIFNLALDCTDFNSISTSQGIITGSSTYHSGPTPPPTPYNSGITINVTDTGWIKFSTSGGTQYYFVSSLGSQDIPYCADCSTVTYGFPFADLANFTITDCGSPCGP
jgi:hypothetical protein